MNVSIKKDALLETLTRNMEKHEKAYNKAFSLYKEKLQTKLEDLYEKVKKAQKPMSVYIDLPVPEQHLKDYARVINMVIQDTRDALILEEEDARKYLYDDWDWMRSFTSNTMAYFPGELPEED
jgi:hypothetical protein